ncbi:MAG: hypothetical protein GWN13_26620, partial [Phycisphaerae bacterium]|nr:hypothetical protein [Phycisphaerae bacterium]
MVEQIRKYNMRMVGPNCMGVFNTNPEIHMNANFAPAQPLEGHIGFISQSGALGAVILEVAHHLQLGISIFTSMGNKADISGNDLLEYYFEDEQTNLILMYLESFGNPRRFLQIARKITKDKPIIVVKAGTTEAGAKAASSHTGALADSDTTIDAMLHQCGVLRVSTIEEMFALGMAFAHQPLPKGNRVAVLTNAGGPGILATDAVISEGLSLAKFSAETEDQLKELLPEEASIHNPVDMIATADQDSYKMALEIILKDENVDSVLVIFVTPILVKSIDVAHKIVEVLSKHQFKTVVTCLMGHEGVLSGVEKLEKHKIPVYRFPESAAKALAAMETYKTYRQKEDGTVRTFPVDKEKAQAVFAKVKEEGRKSLNNSEIQQALEAYGFLFARCIRVQNAEEAIAFASELNTSIVVKVQSEDIIHKSDVGGVKVDLRTEKEIRQAFAEMHDSIKKHYPEAQIEGYTVQEMIKGGKETV